MEDIKSFVESKVNKVTPVDEVVPVDWRHYHSGLRLKHLFNSRKDARAWLSTDIRDFLGESEVEDYDFLVWRRLPEILSDKDFDKDLIWYWPCARFDLGVTTK